MKTKDSTVTTSGMRRCIGSPTFAIDAHEAPITDFPVQPSARDDLGRMCHTHWRQYTRELRLEWRRAGRGAEAERRARAEGQADGLGLVM